MGEVSLLPINKKNKRGGFSPLHKRHSVYLLSPFWEDPYVFLIGEVDFFTRRLIEFQTH